MSLSTDLAVPDYFHHYFRLTDPPEPEASSIPGFRHSVVVLITSFAQKQRIIPNENSAGFARYLN